MMLFFGCLYAPGHFLHAPGGQTTRGSGCPLESHQIDGIFVPRIAGEPQHATQLTHIHGWTVLAMWDRTIDSRPGCQAVFLERGRLLEETMWEIAAREFPKVTVRLVAAKHRDPKAGLSLLRERAAWYLGGCEGIDDREGYYLSGDCARDAGTDLMKAIALLETR